MSPTSHKILDTIWEDLPTTYAPPADDRDLWDDVELIYEDSHPRKEADLWDEDDPEIDHNTVEIPE